MIMETLPIKKKITIDVVSDVVCPWCYIGKKRLETAVDQLQSEYNFDITFRPFQLDPTIPSAGVDYKTHLASKFGSEDQLVQIFQRVETIGESVGIDFKFREIPKAINTLPLHVLLKAAEEEGFQPELTKVLFEAYMVKPKDLSDINTLVAIMQPFGWSESKTRGILNDQTRVEAIKAEIKNYQQLGISGVPFFIINNKYGVSGAQTTETFLSAFQSLKPEDFPTEEANICSTDGNDCL